MGLKKTVSGWDHIFGGLTVVDREFRKSINGFTQMGGRHNVPDDGDPCEDVNVGKSVSRKYFN